MKCYGCGGPDKYPVWPPDRATLNRRFAAAGSHSGSQGLAGLSVRVWDALTPAECVQSGAGKLSNYESFVVLAAVLPFQTARHYGLRAIGSGLQMVRWVGASAVSSIRNALISKREVSTLVSTKTAGMGWIPPEVD